MPTISVPLPVALNDYVTKAVRRGEAPTKAALIRRAVQHYAEESAIQAVLRAKQDVREGKVVYGDLRKILKKMG